MKSNNTKEQFIRLRAEGFSYQSISEKINTSKQTLINWSKELNKQLGNEQSLSVDNLLFKYQVSKIERIKYLCEVQNKLKNELDKRDFKKLTTQQIIKLYTLILNKIISDTENNFIEIEKDFFDYSEITGFDKIKI